MEKRSQILWLLGTQGLSAFSRQAQKQALQRQFPPSFRVSIVPFQQSLGKKGGGKKNAEVDIIKKLSCNSVASPNFWWKIHIKDWFTRPFLTQTSMQITAFLACPFFGCKCCSYHHEPMMTWRQLLMISLSINPSFSQPESSASLRKMLSCFPMQLTFHFSPFNLPHYETCTNLKPGPGHCHHAFKHLPTTSIPAPRFGPRSHRSPSPSGARRLGWNRTLVDHPAPDLMKPNNWDGNCLCGQ